MKYKPTFTKAMTGLVLGISLSLTMPAFAADTSTSQTDSILTQIKTDIEKWMKYTQDTVNTTVQTVSQMLFTPTPNLTETVQSNLSQNNVSTPAVARSVAQSTGDLLNQNLGVANVPSNFTNPSIYVPVGSQDPSSANSNNVNFSYLFENTGFTSGSAQDSNAQNVLRFITGQVDPYQPLSSKFLKRDYGVSQEYIAKLGAMNALSSVGTSNLYQIYLQRKIIDGLGTSAGVKNLSTGSAVANASPLQVEQYNAARRVMNPAWYTQMESASPTTIQRETLYVLAEMRYQQFQQQQQLERLIATVSIMETEMVKQLHQSDLDDLSNKVLTPRTTP